MKSYGRSGSLRLDGEDDGKRIQKATKYLCMHKEELKSLAGPYTG
jgi:hypothetical protein